MDEVAQGPVLYDFNNVSVVDIKNEPNLGDRNS
jgi:hypothetical protein